MFTCLTGLPTAIKSLAEVGTRGVVAMTKAAAGRGGATGRNMPKRQAIIAAVGRGVLGPEPTNTIASANAETGLTQGSIRAGVTILSSPGDTCSR